MRCPSCNSGNPETTKFCGSCGAPLEAVCANCGAENPLQFKFCGECGTPLRKPRRSPEPASARIAARTKYLRLKLTMLIDPDSSDLIDLVEGPLGSIFLIWRRNSSQNHIKSSFPLTRSGSCSSFARWPLARSAKGSRSAGRDSTNWSQFAVDLVDSYALLTYQWPKTWFAPFIVWKCQGRAGGQTRWHPPYRDSGDTRQRRLGCCRDMDFTESVRRLLLMCLVPRLLVNRTRRSSSAQERVAIIVFFPNAIWPRYLSGWFCLARSYIQTSVRLDLETAKSRSSRKSPCLSQTLQVQIMSAFGRVCLIERTTTIPMLPNASPTDHSFGNDACVQVFRLARRV